MREIASNPESDEFDLLVDGAIDVSEFRPASDILIANFSNKSSITVKDLPLSIKNHKLLLVKSTLRNGNERLMARWYDGCSCRMLEKAGKYN